MSDIAEVGQQYLTFLENRCASAEARLRAAERKLAKIVAECEKLQAEVRAARPEGWRAAISVDSILAIVMGGEMTKYERIPKKAWTDHGKAWWYAEKHAIDIYVCDGPVQFNVRIPLYKLQNYVKRDEQMTNMERFVRACDYPGVLDEAAVESHLAAERKLALITAYCKTMVDAGYQDATAERILAISEGRI